MDTCRALSCVYFMLCCKRTAHDFCEFAVAPPPHPTCRPTISNWTTLLHFYFSYNRNYSLQQLKNTRHVFSPHVHPSVILCVDFFVVIRQAAPTLQTLDVKSPAAHPYSLPFYPRMTPWKFRDDISNGSGVIVLTDIQTDRQTDKVTNRHYWKQYHLRYVTLCGC